MRVLTACIGLLGCLLNQTASAEPPAPPFQWTGIYVGGNGGGAWGNGGFNSSVIDFDVGRSSGSFIGGGQFGYIQPLGNGYAIGAEVNIQGSSVKQSAIAFSPAFGARDIDVRTNVQTAFLARFLVPIDNFSQLGGDSVTSRYFFNRGTFFSVDVGAGFGNLNVTALSQATLKEWTANFVARVGVETPVTPQTTVGVSYQFTHYFDQTFDLNALPYRVNFDQHQVMFRVNYFLTPTVIPPPPAASRRSNNAQVM